MQCSVLGANRAILSADVQLRPEYMGESHRDRLTSGVLSYPSCLVPSVIGPHTSDHSDGLRKLLDIVRGQYWGPRRRCFYGIKFAAIVYSIPPRIERRKKG